MAKAKDSGKIVLPSGKTFYLQGSGLRLSSGARRIQNPADLCKDLSKSDKRHLRKFLDAAGRRDLCVATFPHYVAQNKFGERVPVCG